MSAQATWISELREGTRTRPLKSRDATSAVAFDGGELSGGVFPHIIGNSAALRRCTRHGAGRGATDATALINGETEQARTDCGGHSPVQRPVERSICESELRRHSCRLTGKRVVRSRAWRLHWGCRARHWTVSSGLTGHPVFGRGSRSSAGVAAEASSRDAGKTVRASGGTTTIHTDVRVICATHRNLIEMVDNVNSAADLFYRLSVFPIELPRLRDRREDVRLLVYHFAMDYAARMRKRITAVAEDFMTACARHSCQATSGNCKTSSSVRNSLDRPRAEWFSAELSGTASLSVPVTMEDAERSHILPDSPAYKRCDRWPDGAAGRWVWRGRL